MNRIRVTKIFHFEMAHALLGYDGPCKNLHGHSYEFSVTVKGAPIVDLNNPKLGMVIDFGDLKSIIKEKIIDSLDHAVMIKADLESEKFLQINRMFEKHIFTNYQPTCENMLIDFASRIKKELPENVQLYSLRLKETPGSYAEWFSSDQPY